MEKTIRIAIDGPVGAGKSTVARAVAQKLSIVYVDTGAMYRAVALYAKQSGISWQNEREVVGLLDKINLKLGQPEGDQRDGRTLTVLLNGEDVSWEIRKPDMGEGASIVSQYKLVREKLVDLQRKLAKGKSVIMEGRDIGTRVLPEAELKIYMDASVVERAKRKVIQMEERGNKVTYKEAKTDVETRDQREKNRKIDPLRPAEDSFRLDTSNLSVEQVVDRIVEKVRQIT